MASIVDKPKEAQKNDLLGIEKYTKGLIRFIDSSETPITIGIQGEWGSGKTSLLNTIKEELCNKSDAKYYPIWLNTWEYSLLSSPDETLVKIISGLVFQIGDMTKNSTSEKGKKAAAVAVKLLKGIGGVLGGFTGKAVEMVADGVDSSLNKPQDNSIKALRDALQEVIDDAVESSSKKAFIFFIDDLDRLDPAVAVNILELIKNLFDLKKCIFVLAIDYGVVVKGLQSKFGVMTEENEWEFRAFFDKIIQLPFSMPISSYDVSNYLKSLLTDVKYFEHSDLEKDTLNKLVEIVGYSVGTNPRALVRLTNSVSLIEMIRSNEKITSEERVIEFALVCMQIAYPIIYGLVQREPQFTDWGEEETLDILKSKNIDISDLEDVKSSEEFNELWEQTLWKVCQLSSFLKQNVYRISKLLNFIRDNTPTSNTRTMGDTIERLLQMSAFTSVSMDNIGGNKSKRITRLSPKKKQQFVDEMKNFLQNSIKSKYQTYFSFNSIYDFQFWGKGEKRNIWLPIQINESLFDVCVQTNQHKVIAYVNAKNNSEDETISWFNKHMYQMYPEMRTNSTTKDGKRVVILEEYTIDIVKPWMEEYKNIIEKTYNNVLAKIVMDKISELSE